MATAQNVTRSAWRRSKLSCHKIKKCFGRMAERRICTRRQSQAAGGACMGQGRTTLSLTSLGLYNVEWSMPIPSCSRPQGFCPTGSSALTVSLCNFAMPYRLQLAVHVGSSLCDSPFTIVLGIVSKSRVPMVLICAKLVVQCKVSVGPQMIATS